MTPPVSTLGFLTVMLVAACSNDPDLERRSGDYDVVQEGSAAGVTGTLVPANDLAAVPPLTDTNLDTTTSFSIVGAQPDPSAIGAAGQGSLSETLPGVGTATRRPTTPASTAPPPPTTPTPALPREPSPSPSPAPSPSPSPAQRPAEPAPAPVPPQPQPSPEPEPQPSPEPQPVEPPPPPPTATTDTASPPEPGEKPPEEEPPPPSPEPRQNPHDSR